MGIYLSLLQTHGMASFWSDTQSKVSILVLKKQQIG